MTVTTQSPADLLSLADEIMSRANPGTAGLWPRAAALLARQALEQSLVDFWHSHGLSFDWCGTRQQLTCLREYLPDKGLAGQLYESWATLTRACHHQPYELAPTLEELTALLGTVRDFAPRDTAPVAMAAALSGQWARHP